MCLISYKNNFIFFHIPKCAGTSIYELIKDDTENVDGINHTHHTYSYVKELFIKKNEYEWFSNAKKFAIIRNPFKRAISFFKYIKEQPSHYLYEKIKNYNYEDFINFLYLEGDNGIISCYEHLKDVDGNINSKLNIIKLEEINSHLIEISSIIKKDIDKIPLINKSSYPYLETYKTKELVKKIFIEDFNYFYK